MQNWSLARPTGTGKMPRTKSYKTDLLESFKDPQEAAEYLNAALADGDPDVFLLALRDVAEAEGKDITGQDGA